MITDKDIYLFNEGNHTRIYEKFGAHPGTRDGVTGTHFSVWAPNAQGIFVIGDFNGWDKVKNPLTPWGCSGVWTGFIPGAAENDRYKYRIISKYNNYEVEKSDPVGFAAELAPQTASVIRKLDYKWNDQNWMKSRADKVSIKSPASIYEVHLGSWMRVPEENNRPMSYWELAPKLAEYVKKLGFTHVELMPVSEHPFYGSWGYQTTGYFCPTSRYGSPQDFMYFVDHLHQNGIGVILDWVPAHFPSDAHGLGYFDGTHLYEHSDPKLGVHPDWNTLIFNYGRNEVKSFLLSSALYWLDKYHIDGLRVDAVASMLYLDYSRKDGEWQPNRHGGNENLEAIKFLQQMNHVIYENYPDTQTYAEESTAWPRVSKPTYLGGLGFGLKWDMGWMHDSLSYFSKDPIYRQYHHNALTFRLLYAFGENFVLPLSHDEVAHGKGSMLSKMAGDDIQKFANLRLLYSLMYAQTGQKLLFMGAEFAQWREWNHDISLDWHSAQYEPHAGIQKLVADLNKLYTSEPALYELNCDAAGFEWVDPNDSQQSALAFLRKSRNEKDTILFVCNCTPVERKDYLVGVPAGGLWTEVLNSDSEYYWGQSRGNKGCVMAEKRLAHGRPYSLKLTLPPLSGLFFKRKSG